MQDKSRPIAIAADHAGFQLKADLSVYLKAQGYEVLDLGTHSEERVDYPGYGYKLGEAIASGRAFRAVGICGSGVGISIAMNREPAMRAALCQDAEVTKLARLHNDANGLALGARIISKETAIACLQAFLDTDFEGGRHEARVCQLGEC